MMDIESFVSHVLRIGVVASGMLMLFGLILLIANNGASGLTLAQLAGSNPSATSSSFTIDQILDGLQSLNGISFIFLGMMVLIATPVLRVILSVFAFLSVKNWLYVTITLIVLVNLLVAIFVIPGLVSH